MAGRTVDVLAWIGTLLFRNQAFSSNPEENLRAVRWTLGVTHGLAAVVQAFHFLFRPDLASACLGLCAVSFTYLAVKYRTCARIVREETVREIMES